MTDLENPLEQLGRLRRHLEVDLSETDVERLVRAGAERRQRRRVRRTLGTGLVLGAVCSTGLLLLLRLSTGGIALRTGHPENAPSTASIGSSAPGAPATGAAKVVRLADESRAIALVPGTDLAVEEDSAERVHVRLERGRARFEVTRRPERSFSVRAGDVTVRVVGTTFGVELVADRVGVSVDKGAVEVDWGVGQKRLMAGESGWFPPLVMSARPESGASQGPGTSSSMPPKPAIAAQPGSSARQVSGAQELLAEVDAARSRGQPARAVELLRQALREYPNDPRAPLAAFTLGRVLLYELGRPREAAAAFHEVRQKAPTSQFAEDALAREVEAWSRASETGRARALAAAYLEQYPSGRHARRVKALTGLE